MREKDLEARITDLFEIANEADAVHRPVAPIEVLQVRTRIVSALIAEGDCSLGERWALAFEVSALLVPCPTARAMGDLASLLWNLMSERQIRAAEAAIRTTGCYMLRSE